MKSIKKDIVRAITLIPAIILFSIFIAIDIVLDDWVKDKFDESLTTKSNYLKTLVEVNKNGVEFDFSDEFMPEFSNPKKSQYFQLWVDQKPFERSRSLRSFPEQQLVKQALPINSSKMIDVELPDGRSGRAIMSYFHPQVPKRLRDTVAPFQHTAFFTVTVSDEDFSQALLVLDIVFWLLFFTLIIGIRYLVIAQIDKGLKPLILLNDEIAHLKIDKATSSLSKIPNEHIEIAPIRAELLRFIEFSQQTLQEEKRLSADIAHELKTPIAEIISLSELHIQYPNDHRISDSYSQDMLSIAQRMKHIVNNLMMLNQSDQYLLKQQNENIQLFQQINEIITTIESTHQGALDRIKLTNLLTKSSINLDVISFNIITSNLINNALFYSPAQSTVDLTITKQDNNRICIIIQNKLIQPISPEQLQQLFKPLYQIDSARTENQHYGLGLAIVKKLCLLNNYTIEVSQPDQETIQFTLGLNKI